MSWIKPIWVQIKAKLLGFLGTFKRTLYSEKNMNSLNVEYFLAMNIQNLDKNG